jgi:excisionase family DNA binding protein
VHAGNGEPHQQPATADDILSVNEVAELLKLSPRTVGEYGARGVLPSVKIGRHRRFSRRQLETLIAVGQYGGAEGERPGLRAQDIAAV